MRKKKFKWFKMDDSFERSLRNSYFIVYVIDPERTFCKSKSVPIEKHLNPCC